MGTSRSRGEGRCLTLEKACPPESGSDRTDTQHTHDLFNSSLRNSSLNLFTMPTCPHHHHYSHHDVVLVYNLSLRTNFTQPVPLLFFEFRSSNSNSSSFFFFVYFLILTWLASSLSLLLLRTALSTEGILGLSISVYFTCTLVAGKLGSLKSSFL